MSGIRGEGPPNPMCITDQVFKANQAAEKKRKQEAERAAEEERQRLELETAEADSTVYTLEDARIMPSRKPVFGMQI
jgi:hypothetical protein